MSITWQDLRRIAETAQGLQEHDVGIFVDKSGKLKAEVLNPDKTYLFTVTRRVATKTAELQVLVPNVRFDRARVGSNGNVAEVGDALFWRMAAVEKFLLPYYAGFVDLNEIALSIRARFEDPSVLAILHLPDSEPDGGSSDTSAASALERAGTTIAELVDHEGVVTVQPLTLLR